jgi:hypothetical protein
VAVTPQRVSSADADDAGPHHDDAHRLFFSEIRPARIVATQRGVFA